MRLTKDHAGIVNNLAKRRDSFVEHHFAEIAKIGQRIMRRRDEGHAVLLSFFESQRYVADNARVGIEQERGLDLFGEMREKLGLSRFARKLAVAPDNFNSRWHGADIRRHVGHQEHRIWRG